MDVDLSAKLAKKRNAQLNEPDAEEGVLATTGELEAGASGEEVAEFAFVYGQRVRVGNGTASAAAKLLKAKGGDSALSAIDLATTDKSASKFDLDGWNYAPTRAEQARWQREWEKGEAIQASFSTLSLNPQP
jgi:ATP synthase protein I